MGKKSKRKGPRKRAGVSPSKYVPIVPGVALRKIPRAVFLNGMRLKPGLSEDFQCLQITSRADVYRGCYRLVFEFMLKSRPGREDKMFVEGFDPADDEHLHPSQAIKQCGSGNSCGNYVEATAEKNDTADMTGDRVCVPCRLIGFQETINQRTQVLTAVMKILKKKRQVHRWLRYLKVPKYVQLAGVINYNRASDEVGIEQEVAKEIRQSIAELKKTLVELRSKL